MIKRKLYTVFQKVQLSYLIGELLDKVTAIARLTQIGLRDELNARSAYAYSLSFQVKNGDRIYST